MQRHRRHLQVFGQHNLHEQHGRLLYQRHLDGSVHGVEAQPAGSDQRHQGYSGLRQDGQEGQVGRGGLQQRQELRLSDCR